MIYSIYIKFYTCFIIVSRIILKNSGFLLGIQLWPWDERQHELASFCRQMNAARKREREREKQRDLYNLYTNNRIIPWLLRYWQLEIPCKQGALGYQVAYSPELLRKKCEVSYYVKTSSFIHVIVYIFLLRTHTHIYICIYIYISIYIYICIYIYISIYMYIYININIHTWLKSI